MQTVKALRALPGYREGAVFSLDEGSAAARKEVGDVEFVDDAPESDAVFVHSGNGNMAIVQVASADYPQPQVVGEPADGETGEPGAVVDGDGVTHVDVVVPAKSANKADLVAYGVGKVKHDDGSDFTEAELESLGKPELVAKLGL